MRDYRRWHDEYDDPDSALARRLGVVRQRLGEALEAAPPGPVRVVSMCAGQGRDVLGVLPHHPRREEIRALLVELNHDNVEIARTRAAAAGLGGVDVVEGDAAWSDAYAEFGRGDVVLACGIFGNVSDADVETTARHVSMLCAPGATVIWTRHRRPPDLTVQLRRWMVESGFEEVAFDALDTSTHSSVGTFRLRGEPQPFQAGFRFFTFLR
jgi:putative methyltransferase